MGITNTIGSVGQIFQAETMTFGGMTFGGAATSAADLRRQIDDLRTLLAQAAEVPETTRAPVARALADAAAVPLDAPDAKNRILGGLTGARGLLEAATGVAKQAAPLIGAIGAVVGAVTGFRV